MTEKSRRRLNRSSKPGGDSVLAPGLVLPPVRRYRVQREWQASGTGYPAASPPWIDSGSSSVPWSLSASGASAVLCAVTGQLRAARRPGLCTAVDLLQRGIGVRAWGFVAGTCGLCTCWRLEPRHRRHSQEPVHVPGQIQMGGPVIKRMAAHL